MARTKKEELVEEVTQEVLESEEPVAEETTENPAEAEENETAENAEQPEEPKAEENTEKRADVVPDKNVVFLRGMIRAIRQELDESNMEQNVLTITTPQPRRDGTFGTERVDVIWGSNTRAEGLISEGTAHEFLTWRRCLYQMAQSLFK